MALDNVLDKIAAGARSVASSVADTAEDVVNKGKRQVETAKVKGDIRDAFASLGEAVYAAEKGTGVEGSKEELIAKIDELNLRLNEIENERAAEKEQKETERAERAAKKAEDAAAAPAAAEPAAAVCPKCGAARVGTLKFCGNCGSEFTD